MVRKKVRSQAFLAGLTLIFVGAALAICSRPVFTFARDEIQQVPKSQIVMDNSFEIHESQDKMVQFQISIGQKLNILAAGDGNFNFSIANFTDSTHVIQPDQPDVTYLSLEDTNSVNTTWSPTVRLAQPGSYYLIFLARNASSDSPVQIMANVTKAWTEIQTYGVPYQAALIGSNFAYVGLGTAVFGAIVSAFFYPQHRPRKRS
ncbi:MAG: hypothetical protein ABSD73_04955 [Candidatus Bathyarchaeia archaeon]